MQVKEELADRIIEAVFQTAGGLETPKTVILGLLEQYKVERQGGRRRGNVKRYVNQFMAAKRMEGLSEKTLDNYARYLGEFSEAVQKEIHRVTAADIRGYIATKDVVESSRQTILCTIRSFFSWLTREEIIPKNPMLKIPTIKVPKQRKEPLTMEGWEKYRNAAESARDKALLELFYSSACRVSEMAGINIADLNMGRRCIKVLGKGNKERLVYFSHKAKFLLQAYLTTRTDSNPALFLNTRGGGRMSVRSMQKLVSQLGKATSQHVHPHKIRRTMAHHFLNKGGKLNTLQAILGHDNPSTTQIYAQLNDENVRYEYEQIAA